MLITFYNILQVFILAIFWPVILPIVLLKPKYRSRIPARLGLGNLKKLTDSVPRTGQRTFWIHALSVGEITSALPLITGLRKTFPDSRIVVTAATDTGETVARELLSGAADCIISAPLDIMPTVSRYIRYIQPDVFILIETDFWPNLLTSLKRHNIPTLLVNGRISQKSLDAYRKFSFFFRPMFQSFSQMSMQTETDRRNIQSLGIQDEKVHTLGNLKYDTPAQTSRPHASISHLIPASRLIFVAGSTHKGEEQILCNCYKRLRHNHPHLYLVIVPRSPKRSEEILQLGNSIGLHGVKRSVNPVECEDFLIVDTIGELVEFYRHSAITFVGGSLVPEGGHNPIEPAIMSVPVLFGPHMEDFHEIANDLKIAGGASTVANESQLTETLTELISNTDLRNRMGQAAKKCIKAQQGVIARHIDLIQSVL